MADDPLAATLGHIRQEIEMASLGPMPTAPRRVVKCHAPALLKAAEAALKHHQRIPVYGYAATETDPDACPHDPERDWDCHFENPDEPGELLCGHMPEGVVCSCTETPDGERIPWPCDEVADILAALTGEGADGGQAAS